MRTPEIISREIHNTQASISVLKARQKKLERELAELSCPFTKGDKIRNKETGEIAIYADIEQVLMLDIPDVWIFIRKIKKNGDTYKDVNRGYSSDEWEKIDG
jgi:hypothetical protein